MIFHRRFGFGAPDVPTPPSDELLRFRVRLVREEFEEVLTEFRGLLCAETTEDKLAAMRRLAKEVADLRYVAEGALVSFGVDPDAAFAEVHRSNMTKEPPAVPGQKAQKGSGFEEADMHAVVPEVVDAVA